MQINLRKASAIQNEIRKTLGTVKAESTVTVSEFTADVEAVVRKAELEFFETMLRKEALNKALYQIRAAVGKANAQVGISDTLAEVENLQATIALKQTVASMSPRKEFTEINARIVKMKQTSGNERSVLYGDRYNSVETTVVAEADIAKAKEEVKGLKRDLQGLNDKLLNLNVNTLIQLEDPTVITLRNEGLI